MITYPPSDEISQALADFSLHNTDRKAQLVADYVQTGVGQVSPAFINTLRMHPDRVLQGRVADNHVLRRRIPTGRLSTIPRYSSARQ